MSTVESVIPLKIFGKGEIYEEKNTENRGFLHGDPHGRDFYGFV